MLVVAFYSLLAQCHHFFVMLNGIILNVVMLDVVAPGNVVFLETLQLIPK
jgi:hypothetical protein